MPAQIGALYVSLVMNSAPYSAGLGQAQRATTQAAGVINRDLGLAQKTITSFQSTTGNRSFRPYAIIAASKSYESASDRSNLLRGSLLALTSVAGGFAAALGTNLLSRYADTAINLSNQLATVTNSSSNLLAVQEALDGVATRSRSSLQATIALYARSARATEQFGFSQERLLRVTETIQKAFAIGGASQQEAQGAAVQLSQGIASDRFSGDEFRSVAENAPVLLRGIAASLGVSIGKLRQLSKEGQLTAQTVVQAILKASGRIDEEFAKTSINIEQAITQVDNKLLEYVGRTDKAFGATKLLSGGILAIGNNLDSIIPGLTNVAALLGAAFFARNKGAVGAGLGAVAGGAIGSLFGGQGLVTGTVLGGIAGFGVTKKDANGLGVFGRIKADAAAAKAEVVALASAEKGLRSDVLRRGLDANSARRASEGDLAKLAPRSDQAALARELLQVQKLDEQKLTMLDKQREAYQRLAEISSQITPKAAKLVDTQLRSEATLAQRLQDRVTLQKAVTQATTFETAALGKQVTTGISAAAQVKARVAVEKDAAQNESAIARQRQDISDRQVRLDTLSSDADKKAAASRLATGRQIMAQTDEINKLDEARTAQVVAASKVRAEAERAGAQAAKQSVAATATAYRSVADALTSTSRQLEAARRAASPLGQAFSFVRRQGESLVGLFGGPWGVAITAASLIFAKFAADAQERAQAIANARSIIDEVVSEGLVPKLSGGDNAGSLLSTELEKIEGQIRALKTGAADAFDSFKTLLGRESGQNQSPFHDIEVSLNSIQNFQIKDQVEQLDQLTGKFVRGQVNVDDFQTQLAALRKEANNSRFDYLADQVLALANQMAASGPAVDALKQKIVDLQAAAKDPINIVINTTFSTLDQQPVDAQLTGKLQDFAKGKAFTDQLKDELGTLRLVGDARKKAQYTDEEIKKAQQAGVVITDAVKKKIAAYADEKVALENRDAQTKKSAKDDPYERAVQSLEKQTAAQIAETGAIGLGTYALERGKAVQELENAAKEAKLKLSPALLKAIYSEADASAAAAEENEKAVKRQKDLTDAVAFAQDTTSSFLQSLKSDLRSGVAFWDAFGNAAGSAFDTITSKMLDVATNQLFGVLFGNLSSAGSGSSGTGLLGGLLSGLLGGGSSPSAGVGGLGGLGAALGAVGGIGKKAGGGMILGRGTGTSDSIFSMLSNGEFVMNAASTRRWRPILQAMNDNSLPRFAGGGLAGTPSGSTSGAIAGAIAGQAGPTINVQIIKGAKEDKVETTRNSSGGIDIKAFVHTAVNEGLAQGKYDTGMAAAFGTKRKARG